MKKMLAAFLALIVAVGLCACGGGHSSSSGNTPDQESGSVGSDKVSPETAPQIPSVLQYINEDFERAGGFEEPLYSSSSYFQSEETDLASILPLINAGLHQDAESVWSIAANESTWVDLFQVACEKLGKTSSDCFENSYFNFWTVYEGGLIRCSAGKNTYFGEDGADVVWIDYREENGTGFRCCYAEGVEAGAIYQYFGAGKTSGWLMNGPFTFDDANIIPSLNYDMRLHGEGSAANELLDGEYILNDSDGEVLTFTFNNGIMQSYDGSSMLLPVEMNEENSQFVYRPFPLYFD